MSAGTSVTGVARALLASAPTPGRTFIEMSHVSAEARRAWERSYVHPNPEKVLAYQRAYFAKHKERIDRRAKEWRKKNRKRESAHARLRFLRKKKVLTEAQVKQCAEICRLFPKRRIVYRG